MTRESSSDISLKELILKIQDYIRAILRRWKLMCLLGFGTAFLFLIAKWNVKSEYKAELTFMLNEDEQGGLGGLASMLGQFGLAGASAESNFDKIIELSRTRRIAQEALFNTKTLNGETDFLANHYIDDLTQFKRWNKKGVLSFLSSDDELNLKDFRFSGDSVTNFSLLENKALKVLHKALVGKEKLGNDFVSEYNELSGIMSFSMQSGDPNLSIEMVNSIFDNLSSYYTEKAVEKQQANFAVIKSKYDSISAELIAVQTKLALVKDSSLGMFREQDRLAENKLREDELRLQSILVEAEKNRQIAELSLYNNSKYIQLIDKPIPPLKPVNKGRLYFFLLGGFLGGLIGLSYIVIKKMYQDIMSN